MTEGSRSFAAFSAKTKATGVRGVRETARVSDAPRSRKRRTPQLAPAARGRGRRDEPRPKRVARVRHLRARLAYPSRPRRCLAACRLARGRTRGASSRGVFPSRSSRSSAPRRLPPPPSTPSTRGTAGTPPSPTSPRSARRSLCAPLPGTRPARSAWRGPRRARRASSPASTRPTRAWTKTTSSAFARASRTPEPAAEAREYEARRRVFERRANDDAQPVPVRAVPVRVHRET